MTSASGVKSGETKTGPLISKFLMVGGNVTGKQRWVAMIDAFISVSHRPSAFCAQRRAWRTATWVQVETILAGRRRRWGDQWRFLRLARIYGKLSHQERQTSLTSYNEISGYRSPMNSHPEVITKVRGSPASVEVVVFWHLLAMAMPPMIHFTPRGKETGV